MTAKISLDAVRSELPKLLKPRGPLDKVVIATRGSKLALWQSNWVKRLLEAAHPEITVELLIMKTQGDIILDVPLAQGGEDFILLLAARGPLLAQILGQSVGTPEFQHHPVLV